jgi:Tfp pilus assembly protein PilF
VAPNPRIEELKKRVEKDPTSIAFAQLAEEYRRQGEHQQAVDVCRDGLSRHPGYLSARVTLARALMELGQFAEAKEELQAVLAVAPDNLAAIRALADIHQKTGDIDEPFQIAVRPPAREVSLPSLDLPPLPEIRVDVDPALAQLEGWLDAILADRAHTR